MTTLEKTVEMISSLPEYKLMQVFEYAASLRDAPIEETCSVSMDVPKSWDEIDPNEPPLTDEDIAGIEAGRRSLMRGEGHSLAEFLALTK